MTLDKPPTKIELTGVIAVIKIWRDQSPQNLKPLENSEQIFLRKKKKQAIRSIDLCLIHWSVDLSKDAAQCDQNRQSPTRKKNGFLSLKIPQERTAFPLKSTAKKGNRFKRRITHLIDASIDWSGASFRAKLAKSNCSKKKWGKLGSISPYFERKCRDNTKCRDFCLKMFLGKWAAFSSRNEGQLTKSNYSKKHLGKIGQHLPYFERKLCIFLPEKVSWSKNIGKLGSISPYFERNL